MSNNHVGEIGFSLMSSLADVRVENLQCAISRSADAQLADIENDDWQELSEEKDNNKINFYGRPLHGRVRYFVPFNSDENKSLFIKFDFNGKHFECKLNPEGNMTNLAYDLKVFFLPEEKLQVIECRGIAMLAKNEDLGRAHRWGSSGNTTMMLNLYGVSGGGIGVNRYTTLKEGSDYKGGFYWLRGGIDSGAGFTAFSSPWDPTIAAKGVGYYFNDLKEKSPAILYTNDGKPKIEEIEWKGLEETINDLEARQGNNQLHEPIPPLASVVAQAHTK